jgi:urate oxidase
MAARLAQHAHGKSRVRVARVWRDDNGVHHFVEWQCAVLLESDMAHAYLAGDNSGMTATDTVKNTARTRRGCNAAARGPRGQKKKTRMRRLAQVYHVAKLQTKRCSVEAFAVALAEHFVREHPKARAHALCRGHAARERGVTAAAAAAQVSAAEVTVEQKPWARVAVGGSPHDHGARRTRTLASCAHASRAPAVLLLPPTARAPGPQASR